MFQLDLEMAFADGEQVMQEVESIVNSLFKWVGFPIQSPIPRMTYQEAMDRFGSDKPDTRLKHTVRSFSQNISGSN